VKEGLASDSQGIAGWRGEESTAFPMAGCQGNTKSGLRSPEEGLASGHKVHRTSWGKDGGILRWTSPEAWPIGMKSECREEHKAGGHRFSSIHHSSALGSQLGSHGPREAGSQPGPSQALQSLPPALLTPRPPAPQPCGWVQLSSLSLPLSLRALRVPATWLHTYGYKSSLTSLFVVTIFVFLF
jgi:hypothetical protein